MPPQARVRRATGNSPVRTLLTCNSAPRAGLMKETKEASASAAKTRRKSKELEATLSSMAAASDSWNALGGRRSRRGSRDYTDEALQQTFNEIDDDKSGHIDRSELEKVRSHPQNPSACCTPQTPRQKMPLLDVAQAIFKMDPNCKSTTIDEMMAYADDDDDGKVTFEEFKKIMLYKPSQSETGEAK